MNNSKILVVGHAGASSIAPKNTLKAFQKAIDLEADSIEFDLQITKDDKLVLSHDLNILSASGYNGRISEMTLIELKKLDFGEGEKIPTLTELIKIAKNKIGLIFDVKPSGISQKLVQIIMLENVANQSIISSFSLKELIEIRKKNKDLKIGLILSEKMTSSILITKRIKKAIKYNFNSIHLHFSVIEPQIVKFCHDNNLKVLAWTVNNVKDMELLIQMGIDGIITDDIQLLQKVLSSN